MDDLKHKAEDLKKRGGDTNAKIAELNLESQAFLNETSDDQKAD